MSAKVTPQDEEIALDILNDQAFRSVHTDYLRASQEAKDCIALALAEQRERDAKVVEASTFHSHPGREREHDEICKFCTAALVRAGGVA